MVTAAGEAALAQCWRLIGGKREAAARVWESLYASQQFQIILEATHNRDRARELAGALWADVPRDLYPKIRHALRVEIARAERFAAALDQVQ